MIKYLLTEGGIQDRETGAIIPIAEGNRHYQQYLEWIEEGNTPIQEQSSQFHELIDDVWVLNSTKKIKVEADLANEVKIQAKIRELAINSLKANGELSQDFKDK